MAARLEAYPHRVAEALLLKLQEIGQDEALWLTKPLTIKLMSGPDDLKAAKPAILLRVDEVRDSELGQLNVHNEVIELQVVCLSEDVSDPHGALHNLVADARRVVRQNHTLGDLVELLWDHGYKAITEGLAGGVGAGGAILHVSAKGETDEENP